MRSRQWLPMNSGHADVRMDGDRSSTVWVRVTGHPSPHPTAPAKNKGASIATSISRKRRLITRSARDQHTRRVRAASRGPTWLPFQPKEQMPADSGHRLLSPVPLSIGKTEEEPQPRFEIVESHGLAGGVQVGDELVGEARPSEHDQTGYRPRGDVLDGRHDLLFRAAPLFCALHSMPNVRSPSLRIMTTSIFLTEPQSRRPTLT